MLNPPQVSRDLRAKERRSVANDKIPPEDLAGTSADCRTQNK